MPVYPGALGNQQIADKLTREGVHWTQTTLTYSFNDFSTGGNALNATHRTWIEKAITQIEELFGLTLNLVASNGDITFSGTRGQGTYALLNWSEPSNAMTDADIYFDQNWDTNASNALSYGSYGFVTIIHEFLHALGLDHPGNYDAANGVPVTYFPFAEYLQDTHRYTVMSYFEADMDGSGTSHWFYNGSTFDWKYPQTPMVHDILAMTDGSFAGTFAGYNLNTSTRSTNTTYGYNATAGINDVFNFATNIAPVLTLYDSGGTDTLDLSGDTASQKRVVTYNAQGNPIETSATRDSTIIDIRQGAYSSTHGMSNNIGIAFGTIIENVVGTQFNDTITGNDAANSLVGGGGNDVINGGLGADVLNGGIGFDSLLGGDGNDSVFFDQADNLGSVLGGAGDDVLIFTAGGAPTSFSLTAHEFERAEGRYVDTGNNSWASIRQLYTAGWLLDFVEYINDNGTRAEVDYDQATSGDWQAIYRNFDALNRLASEDYVLDDGRRTNVDYDEVNGPTDTWSRIYRNYDSLGRLATEDYIYDNGTRGNVDYDETNSPANTWNIIYRNYDSLGRLATEDYLLDNGRRTNVDYDETVSNSWNYFYRNYDVQGRLDYEDVVFDNGNRTQVDYDQAGQFTWSRVYYDYNSAGILVNTTFVPD
jgi:hypothetical protein